jgi:hypothetical protein
MLKIRIFRSVLLHSVSMQTAEILERGGRCIRIPGYQRRDRAEVGLGKGDFLSHRWGNGDGGWYFAFRSYVLRKRNT